MLSQDDVYLRWQPGQAGEFITIAHPVPKTPAPDLTPVAMFGGYPLALTPSGILIADDHINPFIGVFSTFTRPVWHEDILNTLGIPAVSKSTIFTNVGGRQAVAGLVAVDSSSGQTLWHYAPKGFPEEPVTEIEMTKIRTLTSGEQALERLNADLANKSIAKASGGRIGRGITGAQTETMRFSTPVIDAEHGHWTNPGLCVVKDRVYGQVGTSIVAIEKATGLKKWAFELKAGEETHSLVASPDYLFISLNGRLIALDLEKGEVKWEKPMQRAGSLSLSKGYLFFSVGDPNGADGGEVIVFATDKDIQAEPPPPPRR